MQIRNELIEVNKRLFEKELEMKNMEQKYKQYLEKAKMVGGDDSDYYYS